MSSGAASRPVSTWPGVNEADAKALDYCDAHSRDAVAEAFAGRGFTWPEPDAAQAPSRERPSDLRLQMQPVKLSFMVTKRRQDLIKAGLTLRQEAGSLTIQKLLDQTFFARQRSSGEGSGGVIGFPSDEVMSDVDVGSGFDMREWRRMTFAYSEEMGWAFLHQATSETLAMVKGLVRDIECYEMGLTAPQGEGNGVLWGMVDLFNQTPDVSVNVDEAIVRIAGTKGAVDSASRAIEAVARRHTGAEPVVHWFWRDDNFKTDASRLFPMSPSISATMESAFARHTQSGDSVIPVVYAAGGNMYEANFTLMIQKNCVTGFVRGIERLTKERAAPPLPRCPERHIPLSIFRKGTTYSLVPASEEEVKLVARAVKQTLDLSIAKVEHIWNSFLWGHYAHNAMAMGNEWLLFHGATATSISQICKGGFDKRLAGSKNGAVYGQGCYFARDACKAAAYMDSDSHGQMIMARVLVGESTVGNKSMTRPPRINARGEDRLYDSTTDNVGAPTIFVTYTDWQAYPMYLIKFARF